MKKLITLISLVALTLVSTHSYAQHYSADSSWVHGGTAGLAMNQVGQVNWAAGGENTVGLNAHIDYAADMKKGKHLWNNRFEMDYGFTVSETDGNQKNADNIYLSSIYGYKIAKNLYVSGDLGFRTQFAKGFDYKTTPKSFISDFMAPGYLTIGAGLTWTPKSWITATLTPVTYRGIFVTDDTLAATGQYGVDPGKNYKTELGANLKVEVTVPLMENVELYSRLAMFSDYIDQPQNIDILWDVNIKMKINEWLSASVATSLVYDDDVKILDKNNNYGARVQFQEVIGVGLHFKL